MANVPTPPEPAWIRTFWPFFRLARSINTCQAVRPTTGMDAASSMVRFVGFNATSASFMAMNSANVPIRSRSEEHTSELQSLAYLVCRLLLEKKKQHKPHYDSLCES